MTTFKKPDLTDLWESMARNKPQSDAAINALCFVQASGPAVTLFTNQPLDVAELVARMAADHREGRKAL